jgi:membrane peptidoglycan carboxypeptidase
MANITPLEVEFIKKSELDSTTQTQTIEPAPKKSWFSFFKNPKFLLFIKILSLLIVLVIVGVSIKVFSDYRSAPNLKEQINKAFEKDASKILDRNGEVIYDYKIDAKKEKISLKEVPEILQHALIVREQERFYKDPNGVPWYNLGGAIFNCGKNIITRNGESCRGGSGLFQQIVKNTTGNDDQTITRKYNELLQTIKSSDDLTKDDILEIYFNNITFGRNSNGVQAGSKLFFGHGVNEKGNETIVSAHKACFLASMPNLPDHYTTAINNKLAKPEIISPTDTKNWSYLKKVIDDCLEKLSTVEVIDGKKPLLTKEQALQAKAVPFESYGFVEKGAYSALNKYPYLVEMVKDELSSKFKNIATKQADLENALLYGNYTIKTTFDLKKQQAMEDALDATKYRIVNGGVNMFGSIALDTSTSEVIAMIGNFDPEKVNTVSGTFGYFHPGSSTKPYYYASAFNNGFNPGTVMPDIKFKDPLIQQIRTNAIVNRNDGPVAMRYALQSSLNTVAEESMYLSQNTENSFAGSEGVDNAVAYAKQAGLRFQKDENECLTTPLVAIGSCNVGTISHANAMATILNNGKYNEARTIQEVKQNDKLIYAKADIDKLYASIQQVESTIARQVTNVISDYTTRRNGILSNSAGNFEMPNWQGENSIAAKSGTAQVDVGGVNRVGDLSAIGGTPYYTVLAWTGKVNATGGSTTHGLGDSGSTIVPVWQKMMINLHNDKTPKGFSKEGLIPTKINYKTGLLPSEGDGSVKEELLTQNQINKLSSVKGVSYSDKDNIFRTRTVVTSSRIKNDFDEEVICLKALSLFPDRAEFNDQRSSLAGYIGSGCQSRSDNLGNDTITTNINDNTLFSKDAITIQSVAKPAEDPTKPNKILSTTMTIKAVAGAKEYTTSKEGDSTITFPVKEIEDGKYNIYIVANNSLGNKTTKLYKNIEFKKVTITPVTPNPSTGNGTTTPPNNNIPVPQDPTVNPQPNTEQKPSQGLIKPIRTTKTNNQKQNQRILPVQ